MIIFNLSYVLQYNFVVSIKYLCAKIITKLYIVSLMAITLSVKKLIKNKLRDYLFTNLILQAFNLNSHIFYFTIGYTLNVPSYETIFASVRKSR